MSRSPQTTLVRQPVRTKTRPPGNRDSPPGCLLLAALGLLLVAGLLMVLVGLSRIEPTGQRAEAGGLSWPRIFSENLIGGTAGKEPGRVLFLPLALGAPTASPPEPTRTPAPPGPTTVNGVQIEDFAIITSAAAAHIREIYTRGQALGRDPRAFSKLGDSIIENPHFLARFDEEDYNLGDYVYLQGVIDHYHGSFSRQGVAVQRGLHSWSVFDPKWSDPSQCNPGESVIACEFRLHNPSVVLIRLGSNDIGQPDYFDENMRQVVRYAIKEGVVPVLVTKSDRREGPEDTNNRILREIAADFDIPLWDFDRVAATIPNRGLYPNDVHLTTYYAHDYSAPEAFQTGHGVHNLTALIMLDRILQAIEGD